MTEPVTREFKITVTLDQATNQFSAQFTTPSPDMGPGFVWEALKVAVVAMAKSTPFFPDPVVREHTEVCVKAMKLMLLGIDVQFEKSKVQRQNLLKEMQG